MVTQPKSPTSSLTESDRNEYFYNNSNSHHNNGGGGGGGKKKLIATSTSKTNLYIRGLDENTTDKDLYDLCEKFGEIKSTKAIVDKQTNKCKGYGFVDFMKQEDAKTALSELKKEQKDVQLAKQREQDPTNLYFANLPADIDEQCLNDMLKNKYNATVNSTRIMREKSGASKGVGFARIDDDKLCHTIIQELNGQPFPDNANTGKLIMVKLADSCGSPIVKPIKHTKGYNSLSDQSPTNQSDANNNNATNSTSSFNDSNNNSFNANNLNLSNNTNSNQQQAHSHSHYSRSYHNSYNVNSNHGHHNSHHHHHHHHQQHHHQHQQQQQNRQNGAAHHYAHHQYHHAQHAPHGQFNFRNAPLNLYAHAQAQPYLDFSAYNPYPAIFYDAHMAQQTSATIVSPTGSVPPTGQSYNAANIPLLQNQNQIHYGAQATGPALIAQAPIPGQPAQYGRQPPNGQQYLPASAAAHYTTGQPLMHAAANTAQPPYAYHPAQIAVPGASAETSSSSNPCTTPNNTTTTTNNNNNSLNSSSNSMSSAVTTSTQSPVNTQQYPLLVIQHPYHAYNYTQPQAHHYQQSAAHLAFQPTYHYQAPIIAHHQPAHQKHHQQSNKTSSSSSSSSSTSSSSSSSSATSQPAPAATIPSPTSPTKTDS